MSCLPNPSRKLSSTSPHRSKSANQPEPRFTTATPPVVPFVKDLIPVPNLERNKFRPINGTHHDGLQKQYIPRYD